MAVAKAKREILEQEAAATVGMARAQEAVDIASKKNRAAPGAKQEKEDGSHRGPILLKAAQAAWLQALGADPSGSALILGELLAAAKAAEEAQEAIPSRGIPSPKTPPAPESQEPELVEETAEQKRRKAKAERADEVAARARSRSLKRRKASASSAPAPVSPWADKALSGSDLEMDHPC